MLGSYKCKGASPLSWKSFTAFFICEVLIYNNILNLNVVNPPLNLYPYLIMMCDSALEKNASMLKPSACSITLFRDKLRELHAFCSFISIPSNEFFS